MAENRTTLSMTDAPRDAAIAAARAALRERIGHGEKVRVEDVVDEFPEISASATGLMDLIYEEVVAREERGELVHDSEFVDRFPGHAESIRRQFAVHNALRGTLTQDLGSGSTPATRNAEGGDPVAPPEDTFRSEYEMLGPLGRGGMGIVYRARHTPTDRVVAMKMILSGEYASAQDLARFEAEARLAARVQHPNVVQLFDAGSRDGRPFLAFEYVDGPTLAATLTAGPLAPEAAARAITAIARGVQAAHDTGVIHRDLKPANVLVTAAGVPKVADFGIARVVGSDLTPDGAIVGTPSYMAPEQADGQANRVGPEADVYALGAMLYECLTGRPPFKAATQAATLGQVLADDPAAPRRLNPSVPRDLETVCLKCLNKSPTRRYPAAAAVADDLDRYLTGRPILARPAGPGERAVKWARRRPAVAALLAAAGLATLGAGVGLTAAWRAADRAADAERARAETETAARAAVERQLYANRVALADRERALGKLPWAREQLDRCPEVYRGWEWFYLDRVCRADGPKSVDAHDRGVSSMAVAPAARWVATAGGDGRVRRWHPLTGDPIDDWRPGASSVNAVAVDARGELLAAGLESGDVALWDVTTRTPLRTLPTGLGPVLSVAFSPDGRTVAAAGLGADQSGGVGVWDVNTGNLVCKADNHGGRATAVAFHPATGQLASAGYDGRVVFSDPATGATASVFDGHRQPVSFIAFNPEGTLCASASGRPGQDQPEDATLVWEPDTRAVRHRLRGQGARVMTAAFTPDGRLLTGGWDATLKLWDLQNGDEIVTLSGHSTAVFASAVTPGGVYLSGDLSGRLVLWDGRPQAP